MLLNLGNCLDAAVIPSAPRQTKPTADFTDGDLGTLGAQSLLNIGDYLSPSPGREANFFLAQSSSMASSWASWRSLSSLSCFSYCSLISKSV
ncbi:UNVERIFIED_ORG: hypothetical protein J2806_000642 [Kosakonia oryzae]|uniref:Uncharacterized protein n=1 Tax=Kosakonia radicincitans TaxID=283686 RepID=A0AAX2ELS9_9ENTR|nr:hypothetical protein [Kosakonia oryzae]SFD91598.1 hypothetical protein SAMN03159468_00365 [Kosakonia radicincitans]SFQ97253.1 hypothetical protein SAMN03159514_00365 [Kosakonia radicincitans]SFT39604.1 hypothetical protein SAMN03159428_00364 [Kosakonia radicincitans]SFX08770.1 hypothetical protein SAMN03159436_00364 [Kosakonia radicincitans]